MRHANWRSNALQVKPDDLATLIYTSGTTGEMKGVMLTHGNITSNVVASTSVMPFQSGGVSLCILPLSHILERTSDFSFLYRGGCIAYAEGTRTELEVPVSAESTMCKRCSRYVDLKNYQINSAVSKNFKTKGAFVVEPKGYVFNTEAVVGKTKSSRTDFNPNEDDNALVRGVDRPARVAHDFRARLL